MKLPRIEHDSCDKWVVLVGSVLPPVMVTTVVVLTFFAVMPWALLAASVLDRALGN